MKLPQGLTRGVGRTLLQTKKNSPHIFFAAGILGVIGGTVLACKATLDLEEVLDEVHEDINDVKTTPVKKDDDGKVVYSERDRKKDLAIVTVKSSIKVAKLYVPAAAVGTIGVACLTGSHIQLTRRNAAATAAFTAMSTAFDEYRDRVREELGEEREREIKNDIREEEVEENGKKRKVKVVNPDGLSIYARIFDETSPRWEKSAEQNRIFVQMQEKYHNHLLHARGHVFLNEVYDALGFERSNEGQLVGWVSNGDGDNYIDFGLFEAWNHRFVNGLERSIILDFNVDGMIYDKI